MTEAPTTPQPEAATPVYEDYWGTDETTTWYLPDGQQFFVIQPMNEGGKAKFEKMTNKGVTLSQRTGDAKLDVDPAGERHALINESVVDWKLMQKGPDGTWSPAPFSKRNLAAWLEKAPPQIVDKLVHAIRLANPWMQAEMTVEDIDKEIDRLYELRKQKQEDEAGEGASANK